MIRIRKKQVHVKMHSPIIAQMVMAFPFVLAFLLYIGAVAISNRRYKPWAVYRTVCWSCGIVFAIVSVAGPLAHRSHTDFAAHMIGHLFLGMLAPLLMALASPMTLLLRTLSVPHARRLSTLLHCAPARWMTHPVTASLLNIGGLWILYTTKLYTFMHENILVHLAVHFHVFAAGYVFTVSILYFDPVSRRLPYANRAIVSIMAMAGHAILAKSIYAHPPSGVPPEQAELGGMVMYYGGDFIDIVMIFILCLQWYKATRPRTSIVTNEMASALRDTRPPRRTSDASGTRGS